MVYQKSNKNRLLSNSGIYFTPALSCKSCKASLKMVSPCQREKTLDVQARYSYNRRMSIPRFYHSELLLPIDLTIRKEKPHGNS